MTDDQLSRLFAAIDGIRADISEIKEDMSAIKLDVAVQDVRLESIPKDIKSAVQGVQLKYSSLILGAVSLVGFYCLQVVIPNMVKKMTGG